MINPFEMSVCLTDRILALAGAAQTIQALQHTALHGVSDEKFKAETCTALRGLFVLQPRRTLEIFGEMSRLRTGLQTLTDIFHKRRELSEDDYLARYLVGMNRVAYALEKERRISQKLGHELAQIESRESAAHAEDEQLAENFNSLCMAVNEVYQNTVSHLKHRIKVKGELRYLQKPEVEQRIRTLLLAGIRSVVLWRQCGGNWFRLLLEYKKIGAQASVFLEECSRQKV